MTDIDQLLASARKKSEDFGNLYGRKETSDDYLKTTYAQLYQDARGETVADKDSWVRSQKGYQDAIGRKKDAYAEWKTAETYMKLLFAESEVWRTKQANNRYMDSAHR
jgi:hypothetical protein